MTVFKKGEKPRAQLRLPQGSFIHTDQWMKYLGHEQYCWWLTFHSWVDRTSTRFCDNHIPYTLESVFEKLEISKATFYRKIKVLWECGLIEIVEFDKSERKTTKPRNIIVYDYPFNDAELEYRPLEKLRNWNKDYESQSKIYGIKGALISKGLKIETVKNLVDNSPEKGLRNETVEGLKIETVTVSEMRPNNVYNNLLINSNKSINDSNNSLSLMMLNLIKEILAEFDFSEGERDKIIELIYERELFNISKQDIINQARSMANRPEIRLRAIYFVNGLVANVGRTYTPKKEQDGSEEEYKRRVPFYNWLENDN